MKGFALLALLGSLMLLSMTVTGSAAAHRHSCHRAHTCPSDHATYKWRGLWCVKPTSSKRNATFKRRVTYGGKRYFCKR
jgi:hypothetical protein